MGRYLDPGHNYIDGQTVTGPSLTEHVSEATFNTTAITEQTLKDPVALTDQVLIVSSDAFFQATFQQLHNLILYPGSVVQTVHATYSANTNLTAQIPEDDTIPQNTEGTEIISLSITPRFATSTILITFRGQAAIPAASTASMAAALFRDSIAGALSASTVSLDTGFRGTLFLQHMDSPATISSTTYKVRVGPNQAVTARMNGSATVRTFGGVNSTTITLEEIKV